MCRRALQFAVKMGSVGVSRIEVDRHRVIRRHNVANARQPALLEVRRQRDAAGIHTRIDLLLEDNCEAGVPYRDNLRRRHLNACKVF